MTAMRLKRYPSPSGGIALGKMGVGATMMKQGKTARDYVQNGLIAMWDGIENAGWGVHTTERILTNLATGSSVSIPETGYTIGSDGGIISERSSSFLLDVLDSSAGNIWTLESVGCCETRPTQADNTSGSFGVGGRCGLFMFRKGGVSNGTGVIGGYVVFNSVAKTYYYGAPADTTVANDETDAMVFNEPHSRAGVYNNAATLGSDVLFYYDGVVKDGINQLVGYTPTAGKPSYRVNSPVAASCRIKWWRLAVYNRALTAAEIAANYAIDKERFNLP